MGVSMGMGVNLVLLMAMVATNILSSTVLQSPNPKPPPPVPDQLLHQLHTIRATINHLTRLQHKSKTNSTTTIPVPSDLLLYSHLSPIASSCHNHPALVHKYMTYTPFSLCPSDSDLSEALILRGCHPLPRRRCFSRTPQKPTSSLLQNPFPSALNPPHHITKLMTYNSELDLPIPQFLQLAKAAKSVLRLGLDIGGSTGTFAARMKLYNVTVVTTTMNVAAPYSEAVALRGLVPLHVPLQQRLPLFDGMVDLVRCGHAVNRWIPLTMMEFLLYDVDRVLRGGGYLWLDHFFSKGMHLHKVYAPLIGKLGYKKLKWATANKTDVAGLKNGDLYFTALLQKPVSR